MKVELDKEELELLINKLEEDRRLLLLQLQQPVKKNSTSAKLFRLYKKLITHYENS